MLSGACQCFSLKFSPSGLPEPIIAVLQAPFLLRLRGDSMLNVG
jgi:hypothetical protein